MIRHLDDQFSTWISTWFCNISKVGARSIPGERIAVSSTQVCVAIIVLAVVGLWEVVMLNGSGKKSLSDWTQPT